MLELKKKSGSHLSRLGDRVSKFVEEAAFLESRSLVLSWESLLLSLFLLTLIFKETLVSYSMRHEIRFTECMQALINADTSMLT